MTFVRLGQLKDCKSVANLSKIQELRLPDGKFISQKYFTQFVDMDQMFFVAEANKRIVGFVLGEPMKGRVAYLGLLAVDKKFRNQGIGKKLVSEFGRSCKKKGIKDIILYAPVFNRKTLVFYKKLKFEQGKAYMLFQKVL